MIVQLFYIIVSLAIIAPASGVLARRLHWAMGSPAGRANYPGRIFSFVGHWVVTGFAARDAVLVEQLEEKVNGYKEAEKYKLENSKDYKYLNRPEVAGKLAAIDGGAAVLSARIRNRQVNGWKAAGACLECFSYYPTGLIMALWCLCIGPGFCALNGLIFILGVATGVYCSTIAKR